MSEVYYVSQFGSFLAIIVLVAFLGWMFWTLMNRERDRNYIDLESGLVRKIAEKLDVDLDVAQQAACSAEHTLGQDVISRLLCFIDFINHSSKNGKDLKDSFKRFCDRRTPEPRASAWARSRFRLRAR